MQRKFFYIPSLDVLRGFAVLLVLFLHGSYGFFKGGWIGVDLFFVLSGYLITSLLLNEYINSGKISILKFYARRALRLFPPLILSILLANALWSFTELYTGANRWQATIAALFYFTNLIPGNVSGNMAHLWSLSVEEHFYLFWPFITSLFFVKLSYRNSIFGLIVIIFAVAIFRIVAHNLNFQHIDSFKFTLCRIDVILLGVLLAIILSQAKYEKPIINDKTATKILLILLFSFMSILFILGEGNIYLLNGGFIITNLICALTVFMAINNPNHFLSSGKTLRWLGIRSYGIYVYHFPIFLAFESLRVPHSVSNYLIITLMRFVVTLIIAEFSYVYVELPILKLKDRVTYRKLLITPKDSV